MSKKSKLLLHFCCGPCGPEISELLGKDYEIVALWYNPNIYPQEEYEKRFSAFKEFCVKKSITFICGDGMTAEEFLRQSKQAVAEGKIRCEACYDERIRKTSEVACSLGIKYFSTTLLSSFYQKIDIIKRLCEYYSQQNKLSFMFGEFWNDYYKSKNKARDMGLYLQNYCGCYYSMLERDERRRTKKRLAD